MPCFKFTANSDLVQYFALKVQILRMRMATTWLTLQERCKPLYCIHAGHGARHAHNGNIRYNHIRCFPLLCTPAPPPDALGIEGWPARLYISLTSPCSDLLSSSQQIDVVCRFCAIEVAQQEVVFCTAFKRKGKSVSRRRPRRSIIKNYYRLTAKV